ncbi:TPA: hypothetical protein ACKQCE_001658 [Serratia marcescens]
MWIEGFVPLSVIAAVILFTLKEILEYRRRGKSDSRKIAALKHIFARECQLNLWTIVSIRKVIESLGEDYPDDPSVMLDIIIDEKAKEWAKVIKPQGDDVYFTVTNIPDVHLEAIKSHFLDAIGLDEKLFRDLEYAYDSLLELKHVRFSLLTNNIKEELFMTSGLMRGFYSYSITELEKTENALAALYLNCTGKTLDEYRVR